MGLWGVGVALVFDEAIWQIKKQSAKVILSLKTKMEIE